MYYAELIWLGSWGYFIKGYSPDDGPEVIEGEGYDWKPLQRNEGAVKHIKEPDRDLQVLTGEEEKEWGAEVAKAGMGRLCIRLENTGLRALRVGRREQAEAHDTAKGPSGPDEIGQLVLARVQKAPNRRWRLRGEIGKIVTPRGHDQELLNPDGTLGGYKPGPIRRAPCKELRDICGLLL